MPTDFSLAQRIIAALKRRQLRLVCAESCTAGGVAAALASVPGASQVHCGGFVVYRNASKQDWLGVSQELLDDPQKGSVSPAASFSIAMGALRMTPEADLALGITGDVGPGAPRETDGTCYLSLVEASAAETSEETAARSEKSLTVCLSAGEPRDADDIEARVARLQEATNAALGLLWNYLAEEK